MYISIFVYMYKCTILATLKGTPKNIKVSRKEKMTTTMLPLTGQGP